jgi:hypothetical protein
LATSWDVDRFGAAFPVYEIVTVARPAHRLLYFFVQ